jgi:hypothetical protein
MYAEEPRDAGARLAVVPRVLAEAPEDLDRDTGVRPPDARPPWP